MIKISDLKLRKIAIMGSAGSPDVGDFFGGMSMEDFIKSRTIEETIKRNSIDEAVKRASGGLYPTKSNKLLFAGLFGLGGLGLGSYLYSKKEKESKMIKISNQTLTKVAFWDTFDAGKSDYNSFGGYAREYGNRAVGALPGGALMIPSAVLAQTGIMFRKPVVATAGGLGILSGLGLGLAGDYVARRKSEEAQGKIPQGFWPHIGRNVASMIGGSVLPFVGSPLADYAVSRHMNPPKDANPSGEY